MKQPIPLTPEDVSILIRCPLHYHFAQQKLALASEEMLAEQALDRLTCETIFQLHAAGGPNRMSLEDCLAKAENHPLARQMIETYYRRLERDWPRVIAGNETMTLRIFISRVSLVLSGTVDRLDTTRDGGILAILIRTGPGPLPSPTDLRENPAMTIYHALVATTYPLKRPVRMQELWLRLNQEVTIELSEEEYRHNLSYLREPVQALARGEVRARPGLHCDVCPFKYQGCPVYAHDADAESGPDDFEPPATGGKMSPRQWIFKI
jgi:RecB family exonuclease